MFWQSRITEHSTCTSRLLGPTLIIAVGLAC